MASLAEIRVALASTIEEGVQSEVFAYNTVPDITQLPAIVVRPASADFTGAFQRGLDTWEFDVFVLTSRSETQNAQEILDSLVSGAGENSVRQVLFNEPGLGLDDGFVEAFVHKMIGYGGEFENARVPHVGAILKVRVHTDGAQ